MSVFDALDSAFGRHWSDVLQHLDDAVIVMDQERQLCYANGRARSLLGYSAGDRISGRCRHTTHGVDCELGCPLTFALEQKLGVVKDFETTYRGSDGRDLHLRVTVVPLRDDAGAFSGAVEILRPSAPKTGFFLSGTAPEINSIRERLTAIAASGADLVLIGERAVRRDVARALHRIAGLDETLFRSWPGSWEEVPHWPAGTRYADGDDGLSLFDSEAPQGWRRVVGAARIDGARSRLPETIEIIELPDARAIRDDLPTMVTAWASQMDPDVDLSPSAIQRLVDIALETGFEAVGAALRSAVAVSDGELSAESIPGASDAAQFLDRLLRDDDPLASLERALLREVLERCSWKMQDAADRLGISRVTLWRKLKEHGINKPG